MPHVAFIAPLAACALVIGVLLLGAYLAAVLKAFLAAGDRRSLPTAIRAPLYRGSQLLSQRMSCTERPDMLLWTVAPAAYAAVAACALTVVPLGENLIVADVRTGIVLYGAAEALAIVAVFLHGWSPNSHLPMIGGYRFVALGLSYELLSMFVLIAAALPAESMRISTIVASQQELWNIVRQPLGLPLWIIVTLGITFTGPLNLADSGDLAAGTSLETSGRHLLLWQLARGAMLTVFCIMGAAIFLGGWLGPWLPGWVWIVAKTLVLMTLILWLAGRFARLPIERAVLYLWTIGLPLSFLHLLLAGIEALL